MDRQIFTQCTGVAVLKGNRVLLGLRRDGQGWGLAGGKKEPYETMEACGIRELYEEFGLVAEALEFVGIVEAEAVIANQSAIVQPSIFCCRRFTGNITIDESEHIDWQWFHPLEALSMENLFLPSRRGLELLMLKGIITE